MHDSRRRQAGTSRLKRRGTQSICIHHISTLRMERRGKEVLGRLPPSVCALSPSNVCHWLFERIKSGWMLCRLAHGEKPDEVCMDGVIQGCSREQMRPGWITSRLAHGCSWASTILQKGDLSRDATDVHKFSSHSKSHPSTVRTDVH